MDVPIDMEGYVDRFLSFLTHYEWVYNFKAIEILMNGNIEKMPRVLQENFNRMNDNEFQNILEHRIQDSWSSELKSFTEGCLLLKCAEEGFFGIPCASESNVTAPEKWSEKKHGEVLYLSEFVGANYSRFNCDKILDIGAGLGYLSMKICSSFGASVIAIEGNPKRVESAQKLLTNKGQPLDIQFVNMYLNGNISNQISPLVDLCNAVCITGLHACGDLSNRMLHLFVSDYKYKVLSIVPCCYHKMDLVNFENFPISQTFRKVFSRNSQKSKTLLGYQFCRLASQRAGKNFLHQVSTETNQIIYRSIMERYVHQGGYTLLKNKRKSRTGCLKDLQFRDYVLKSIGPEGAYSISSNCEKTISEHVEALIQLHDELKKWSKSVTGILALQGAMQSLAEQFILMDKVQFLKENSCVADTKLKRIIPESFSPRGVVIYAVKKS